MSSVQEPSVRAWIEAGDLRGAASFLVVQYAADDAQDALDALCRLVEQNFADDLNP